MQLYFHRLQICILIFAGTTLLYSCREEFTAAQVFENEPGLDISFKLNKRHYVDYSGSIYIDRESEPFRKLYQWFDDHRDAWSRNEGDNLYQLISIFGRDTLRPTMLQIYIHDKYIKVGFPNEQGHLRQYFRQCNPGDFDFLLALKQ